MKDVLKLSAKEALSLMHKGELSPLSVAIESLNAIKNSDANSFITIAEESAILQAENSTKNIINQKARRLEGLPIAIKDLFCLDANFYKGLPTTAGSKILDNFFPQYESTVTERLKDQGMVMIGKTNMDEFAMGSSNETSYFGPVKNPWNKDKVSGGSSGGSASAVADFLCFAALGSDTGGSVRQPASMCGIVGIKPSYGRCSRFGMIPYASSFDQAGVMARNIEDACIILDEIMGYCPKDSRSLNVTAPKLSDIQGDVRNMKIGYIPEYMDMVDYEVKLLWEKSLNILKDHGAQIVPIPIARFNLHEKGGDPSHKWLAVYYAITPVEAFSNLAKYDGIKFGSYVDGPTLKEAYTNTRDQFGAEVKKRLILGCNNIINEPQIFAHATSYRQNIKNKFNQIFQDIDAIICPTSPHEAFDIGCEFVNPVNKYLEDVFTVVANLIEAPAMSIPAGFGKNNLPLGMQIMCQKLEEVSMIKIGKVLEQEFKFQMRGEQ